LISIEQIVMITDLSARRAQIEYLRDWGYVVVPRFVPPDALLRINVVARAQLAERAHPLEFEADLRYPGAPTSRTAAGGTTVRRLLGAYGRDPVFRQCASTPVLRKWMQSYFQEDVLMSRAHHNCLMTKHPLYGSLTGWHRDIRYWSFAREDLVSVWFALGREESENGALWFVPGSHRMEFGADDYDDAKCFRADHACNAKIISARVSPRLEPGDAVFFHCKTLHSAGRNQSQEVKISLVFSYHAASNLPCPGTRSSSQTGIPLA
jgi:phytanoyl-CoA hydroxylase